MFTAIQNKSFFLKIIPTYLQFPSTLLGVTLLISFYSVIERSQIIPWIDTPYSTVGKLFGEIHQRLLCLVMLCQDFLLQCQSTNL